MAGVASRTAGCWSVVLGRLCWYSICSRGTDQLEKVATGSASFAVVAVDCGGLQELESAEGFR